MSSSATKAIAPSAFHPSFEVIGTRISMLFRLKSLQRPYLPFPLVGSNRHVETIFAAFFRSRPAVDMRRECLRTPDDGAVALDWVLGDDRRLPHDSPVLVLLPGLTGGSGDSYVRHMLVRARNKGWRVVVFNSRGCANSPVTTPKFYSASFTDDLCQVVNHVSTRYPRSKVYAIGWSLGGNILVRYLGEFLCVILSIWCMQTKISKRVSIKYMTKHLEGLCEESSESINSCLKGSGANTTSLGPPMQNLLANSTRHLHVSVDDYYFNASSSRSIEYVRTPLLCIQAANDPFAPYKGIPHQEIKENPYCLLIVTPRGGHLGWVAGEGAPFGAPWTDEVVMEFLERLQEDGFEAAGGETDSKLLQMDTERAQTSSLGVHVQG